MPWPWPALSGCVVSSFKLISASWWCHNHVSLSGYAWSHLSSFLVDAISAMAMFCSQVYDLFPALSGCMIPSFELLSTCWWCHSHVSLSGCVWSCLSNFLVDAISAMDMPHS
jgi:hypothetical protein